jgi:hypothetical protein
MGGTITVEVVDVGTKFEIIFLKTTIWITN